MKTALTLHTSREVALSQAWALERRTGTPRYVVKTVDGYEVTDRMPLLGTWWTADGIRHG